MLMRVHTTDLYATQKGDQLRVLHKGMDVCAMRSSYEANSPLSNRLGCSHFLQGEGEALM